MSLLTPIGCDPPREVASSADTATPASAPAGIGRGGYGGDGRSDSGRPVRCGERSERPPSARPVARRLAGAARAPWLRAGARVPSARRHRAEAGAHRRPWPRRSPGVGMRGMAGNHPRLPVHPLPARQPGVRPAERRAGVPGLDLARARGRGRADRAARALRAHVAEGPVVWAGFSLGAHHGARIAQADGAAWPLLALAEGGTSSWTRDRRCASQPRRARGRGALRLLDDGLRPGGGAAAGCWRPPGGHARCLGRQHRPPGGRPRHRRGRAGLPWLVDNQPQWRGAAPR